MALGSVLLAVFLISGSQSLDMMMMMMPSRVCYSGNYLSIEGMYTQTMNEIWYSNNTAVRLCAFREDRGRLNGSDYLHRSYMALNITNTLLEMSTRRCQGFSNDSDIGFGYCDPKPFELYNTTILCICATDYCNRDLETCRASVMNSNMRPPRLPEITRRTNRTIQCHNNFQTTRYVPDNGTYETLEVIKSCLPKMMYHPITGYMISVDMRNQMACEEYVRSHMVVCSIETPPAYSSSGYYHGSNYFSWTGPYRQMGFTMEDLAPVVGSLLARSHRFSPLHSMNMMNDAMHRVQVFEGPDNMVIIRTAYDLAGNPLNDTSKQCFCAANNCNSDFETCSQWINFTETPDMDTTPMGGYSTPETTTYPMRSTMMPMPSWMDPNPVARYRFDINLIDQSGNFNGSSTSGITFTTFGYVRFAMAVNRVAQFFQTGPINLAFQSFTVSGWFSPRANMNITLFTQCPPNARGPRRCLVMGTNDGCLFMDFGGFSVRGRTAIVINQWYHIAFVYDMSNLQQMIYVNGMEDGRSEPGSTPPFAATCEPVRLAMNYVGLIDEVSINNRAKSSAEILMEATLFASYSFEGDLSDDGPNGLNGSGMVMYAPVANGGQALVFNDNDTMFQANGMTIFSLVNQTFSVALKIKPFGNATECNIVTLSTPRWCHHLIGISSSNMLLFKIGAVSLPAGVLSNSSWTRVVYSYSIMNGYQFYVNGSLIQTLHTTFTRSDVQAMLSIGGMTRPSSVCTATPGGYRGMIDNLKVYSRELSMSEIRELM